jgi:hypothetical protein
MKFLKYTREILIIGLAIFVVLLFVKPCGKEKVLADNKVLKFQADSLRAVVKKDSIAKAEDHFRDSLKLIEAHKQTLAARADVKAIDKKLSATQSDVRRLSSLVLNRPVDIILDSVGCDSLALAAVTLSNQVDQYRKEADEVMGLLNYEVVLRDSIIEDEKAYSKNLLSQFNAQATVLKNALDAGKPRGRFLAGAGIIGNQTNFLSGAKVAFAYQTKGGKQYQAGALIVNKELMYEGTVLITLFK